jgi:hypothetical protein
MSNWIIYVVFLCVKYSELNSVNSFATLSAHW